MYRYFNNKQEALLAIIEEVGDNVYENSEPSHEKNHRKRIRSSFGVFIKTFSEYGDLLKVWKDAARVDNQFKTAWDSFHEKLVGRARGNIEDRLKVDACVSVDAEIAAKVLIGILENPSERVLSEKDDESVDLLVDTSTTLWYRALYYPAGSLDDRMDYTIDDAGNQNDG